MTVKTLDMREQILDVATRLVQTLGYDGFSFADVAERVGIRKASIHHHFATKGDLGRALVERFRADCRASLDAIDGRGGGPWRRLVAFARVFESTLAEDGRFCLCGMLAAGCATLPDPVRAELVAALSEMEAWLEGVLRDGRDSSTFRFDGPPGRRARTILGGLEGAMLLARAHGEPARLRQAIPILLEGLRPPATAPR